MTDKDKKLYEKFDKAMNQVVVWGKAASIDAKVDCIYPESFMIGILTTGANEVTTCLLELNVDLEKCLKAVKKNLLLKREANDIGDPNFEDLKISKQIQDVTQTANKIRLETIRTSNIGVQHVFLAILRVSDDIRAIFAKENVTEEIFLQASIRVKETASAGPVETNAKSPDFSALSNFCVDVTKQAKENKLDPIIAREKEIESAITVLCRRSKNNPILLGEPGVGKSALVEGIAQRIVSGTVPKQLLGQKLYSLNVSSLVAGTKFRGEFEERIQLLVREIQESTNCILFIDEIHTLVGAGSASGSALDASTILKPFLARSDLRCIGATTLDDYKKYFQKDGALARRFQQIMVEEPTKEQVKSILLGIKFKIEEWHKTIISDDAIDAVINLSDRYLKDRYFPDKAIDCIDTACAKYAWATNNKQSQKPIITAMDIAKVISEQCSIPMEVILWDDNERIIKIEEILSKRVLGQKNAIDTICRILKNAYSGVRNPEKPIGSFVFGGQSGTGKTYMAKELAKAVFGKETSFIRLDMTEFSEPHSVSKLIGSPPGYVGFQETDRFIDRVKRKPYCLILLDEIEKAHADVIKLFLQVMSDGIMTDSSGNKADLKNVILIMTGNFGMDNISKESLGFSESEKKDPFYEAQDKLVNYCKERYGSEFINRVDEFIPFMPLEEEVLKNIVQMRLEEVCSRIVNRNCKFVFTSNVYDFLIKKSKEEHGKNATILGRLMSKKIEPCLSDALMSLDKNRYIVTVDVEADNLVFKKKKSNEKT